MLTTKYNTGHVREFLADAFDDNDFVLDKSGCKVIELIGINFKADAETILGKVNREYVDRELEWYKSQSLYVDDIPGGPPQIWKDVSSSNGMINSNYGWCTHSAENGSQYVKALAALTADPNSRRSIMIYTRPSMQTDYNRDGMSDFMCTNTVQYLLRDNYINAVVSMRSNDVWAGYRNDYAWQKYVLDNLVADYNLATGKDVKAGDIIWSVGSLHLYERQFYLLENYIKTGEIHCTKQEYEARFKS